MHRLCQISQHMNVKFVVHFTEQRETLARLGRLAAIPASPSAACSAQALLRLALHMSCHIAGVSLSFRNEYRRRAVGGLPLL